mmetsp:Transcript_107652/g.332539  ORF Transcript_107652/g.332539 Transcript_107652/m.332539 type:complete len:481 (+) Transcript_107652:151-1593(+)
MPLQHSEDDVNVVLRGPHPHEGNLQLLPVYVDAVPGPRGRPKPGHRVHGASDAEVPREAQPRRVRCPDEDGGITWLGGAVPTGVEAEGNPAQSLKGQPRALDKRPPGHVVRACQVQTLVVLREAPPRPRQGPCDTGGLVVLQDCRGTALDLGQGIQGLVQCRHVSVFDCAILALLPAAMLREAGLRRPLRRQRVSHPLRLLRGVRGGGLRREVDGLGARHRVSCPQEPVERSTLPPRLKPEVLILRPHVSDVNCVRLEGARCRPKRKCHELRDPGADTRWRRCAGRGRNRGTLHCACRPRRRGPCRRRRAWPLGRGREHLNFRRRWLEWLGHLWVREWLRHRQLWRCHFHGCRLQLRHFRCRHLRHPRIQLRNLCPCRPLLPRRRPRLRLPGLAELIAEAASALPRGSQGPPPVRRRLDERADRQDYETTLLVPQAVGEQIMHLNGDFSAAVAGPEEPVHVDILGHRSSSALPVDGHEDH